MNSKVEQWMDENEITSAVERIDARSDGGWTDMQGANHYRATFRRGPRGDFTVEYSQGSGITSTPTGADILRCVAGDIAPLIDGATFEDWASDYGLDSDSRKAERTYNAIAAQLESIRTTLGIAPDGLIGAARADEEGADV